MNILERIEMNPEIMHGKPSIRGMRWTVEMVIDMLGSGMSIKDIVEEHPELEPDDVLASLKFANFYLSGKSIQTVLK